MTWHEKKIDIESHEPSRHRAASSRRSRLASRSWGDPQATGSRHASGAEPFRPRCGRMIPSHLREASERLRRREELRRRSTQQPAAAAPQQPGSRPVPAAAGAGGWRPRHGAPTNAAKAASEASRRQRAAKPAGAEKESASSPMPESLARKFPGHTATHIHNMIAQQSRMDPGDELELPKLTDSEKEWLRSH